MEPSLLPDLFPHATLVGDSHSAARNNLLDEQARLGLLARVRRSPMNREQRQAVEHVEGPMLVLSVAGSGKTRVVSHRAANLVGLGYRPRKILLVTFTNNARDEMESRCGDLLKGFTWGRPTVLTLHSLGFRILRRHPELAGLKPDGKLVSDVYQDKFIQRALTKVPFDQRYRLGKKGDQAADTLKNQIGLYKNRMLMPEDLGPEDEWARDAYFEYQKWLKRGNLIDCDDLVLLPVQVFNHSEHGAAALREWQKRFDFIMVDEYQDTSLAQFELVRLLAQEHRNIAVVGDDDQSIYGWRAADVSLIRDFPKHWPGAKVVTLETNYRSTQGILDLGNSTMQHEEGRHPKVLRAHRSGGIEPVLIKHDDDKAEATWIAQTIQDSRESYDSFAILVRSKAPIEPIMLALAEHGIPYRDTFRDKFRLADLKRNILALLAAADHPEREEPAFMQLLEGSRFAPNIEEYERFMDRRDRGDESLWRLLGRSDLVELLPETRDKFAELRASVEALHDEAARKPRRLSLAEITFRGIQTLYPEAAAAKEWQAEEPTLNMTNWLRNIHARVDRYETNPRTRYPSLRGFLGRQERIRRLRHEPVAQGSEGKRARMGAVLLSTIHGAKGLEFRNVFLPGLVQGHIPSRQSMESHDPLPMTEERRLFYVAVTRAMNRLWLSFPACRTHGRTLRDTMPSQYLYESGAHLLSGMSGIDITPAQGELFG